MHDCYTPAPNHEVIFAVSHNVFRTQISKMATHTIKVPDSKIEELRKKLAQATFPDEVECCTDRTTQGWKS